MEQLFTFGTYLRDKFGCRVYKVGINITGFTCPNIDGTVAKGGCTFCENDSFSASKNKIQELKGFYLNLNSKENPYLASQLNQLQEQFDSITKNLKEKYGAEKFIVYFQSWTNTYAPFDTLKALYEKALSFDDVIGLSIGTRSDSITDEVMEYLSELSKIKEIWVEFGVQSIYDETLKKINRGHDVKSVKEVIKKAKDLGLNVCAHLIFGLPSETKEMMIESATTTYTWGIDSIKYHPLYVVKRTALGNDYLQGKFKPISKDDYIDVLTKAILKKPKHISIQRLTAGIDDASLLAPMWCKDKNQQIKDINKALKPFGLKY